MLILLLDRQFAEPRRRVFSAALHSPGIRKRRRYYPKSQRACVEFKPRLSNKHTLKRRRRTDKGAPHALFAGVRRMLMRTTKITHRF